MDTMDRRSTMRRLLLAAAMAGTLLTAAAPHAQATPGGQSTGCVGIAIAATHAAGLPAELTADCGTPEPPGWNIKER